MIEETVLLLEEDSALRRRLRKFLEYVGLKVLAPEAFETARTLLHQGDLSIRLVVISTDWVGQASVIALNGEFPELALLLIGSGSALDEEFPHLAKPFPPERLAVKVQKMLTGPATVARTA
jgi:DNA-binding NtrC family response regulator